MTVARFVRRWIVTLGIFPCLLATSAGAQAQPIENTGVSGALTVWHAYGEAEEAGLRAALDAFIAVHPDVRITTVAIPFGAYNSKLETAIPAHRGPDVFIGAHDGIESFTRQRLVAPLQGVDEATLADLEPAHVEAFRDHGALYGLPIALKCAALYVNDALLPSDPASLEAIARLRPSLPADRVPLVLEAESIYYVIALTHAFGGELLTRDGEFALQGRAAEQSLAVLRRLLQRRVVPEETSGSLVEQMFGAGRAAAAVSGPWLAPKIPASVRWRVVPLPRVEAAEGHAMVPFVTVEGMYLANGSQNPRTAAALVSFIASHAGSLPRAKLGRQVVASRSASADPTLSNDAFLLAFRRAALAGVPMPTHPHMRAVFEPANRALRKVLRGDMSAPDALREAAHRFDIMTREPPPRRDPTIALVLVSLLTLAGAFLAVRRALDPAFRSDVRMSLPAYAYLTHAVLAVGLLVVAPLTVGALTSFFAGRGRDLTYVGLANYVDILTAQGGDLLGHGSFWLVLLVTVAWTAANLTLHVAIGVGLALLLYRPALKLRGIYRVVLILPWAVPSYVTALAWKGMFHRQFGAVNAMLAALGAEPISWFAKFSTAFTANVATNVWLGFPFMMVVTLGALTAIPKDLYEAASVDGATAWQRFKLITLPLLRPALAPAVAMGAVWTFNMFNVVFLVSGGEPDGTTEILVSEAYRWAFTRSQQYGYAAAYSVLIFAILALATARRARVDGAGATR